MALSAVITEIGKRRIGELAAGFITGPFSPGGLDQLVRPVHFLLGVGGQTDGRQKPPDATRVDLEAPTAIGSRIQKALVGPVGFGNDINVNLGAQEPTVEFKLVLTAAENNLGAGITVAEVGVFVQFGANAPDLFVYGTFPPFLSDGTLAVDLRLNPKI